MSAGGGAESEAEAAVITRLTAAGLWPLPEEWVQAVLLASRLPGRRGQVTFLLRYGRPTCVQAGRWLPLTWALVAAVARRYDHTQEPRPLGSGAGKEGS